MGFSAAFQKNVIVAVVALGGGFAGSMIHDWMRKGSKAIRAERFEVVGTSGNVLSVWGPDSDPKIPVETPKGILLVFMDANGKRRCQVGSSVGDYAPELNFYGSDSAERVNLGLTAAGEDPILVFRNAVTWRVQLGAMPGDVASRESSDTWRLQLRSGKRSNIGAYAEPDGRVSVNVTDEKGRTWSLPPHPGSR
jgi:hypothetical protein